METDEQRRARQTANTRRYRERHPEKVRASRRKLYQSRKKKALELLGGAECIECGCRELSFLEINHINGGGAQEWKKYKCSLQDAILSGERKTDDLNVLCRVCNAVHFLEGKTPGARGCFRVTWQNFTGRKATLETSS